MEFGKDRTRMSWLLLGKIFKTSVGILKDWRINHLKAHSFTYLAVDPGLLTEGPRESADENSKSRLPICGYFRDFFI